jgi:rubredoxin/uncharacterized membrane protein
VPAAVPLTLILFPILKGAIRMNESDPIPGGTPTAWRCTVCGYIHRGPEPPEKCPVCGADRSKFEPLVEEASVAGAAEESVSEASSAEAPTATEKPSTRWRCTVCGYIHIGAEPPEKCSVCGADRSKFVPLEDEPAAAEQPEEPVPHAQAVPKPSLRYYRMITEQMTERHAHPISVHIPNGVAPVAVFFALMAALFGSPVLEHTATANLVIVLLSMPFVLFSGYNDWQRRYGGKMTKIFKGKIICGGLFTVLAIWLVLWRVIHPEILVPGASGRWFYLLLLLSLVATGAVAGYLGGKLVFGKLPPPKQQ